MQVNETIAINASTGCFTRIKLFNLEFAKYYSSLEYEGDSQKYT
jgi:hypothetical protein